MIVCQCNLVSDSDLAEAVDAGARTLGEACRRTGAAQACGTCVFSVRKAICDHVTQALPPREDATLVAS